MIFCLYSITKCQVLWCGGLGRFFRFVCIYACTSVFLCCYRFSANKDLCKNKQCTMCKCEMEITDNAVDRIYMSDLKLFVREARAGNFRGGTRDDEQKFNTD